MAPPILRYLQGLNWALLAIGVTFTVVLSVVALLLYVNLGAAPRYQPEFEQAMASTLVFAFVMVAAAAAVWTHRTQHVLRWPAEILLVVAVLVVLRFFLPG